MVKYINSENLNCTLITMVFSYLLSVLFEKFLLRAISYINFTTKQFNITYWIFLQKYLNE